MATNKITPAEYEIVTNTVLPDLDQDVMEMEKVEHLKDWQKCMSTEEYNSWECLTPKQFVGRLLHEGILSAWDFEL